MTETTDVVLHGEVVDERTTVVLNTAEGWLEAVENMGPIKTDADDAAQKELQVAIKRRLAEWDEERHSLTDPLEKVKRDIIARFKVAAEPAQAALAILNERIKTRYLEVQAAADKERLRQERLAAKRMERAQARAEKTGQEVEPIIPLPTVAPPAKTTTTTQGRVTVREVWKFRVRPDAVQAIVDAGRLDLLEVNEKVVGATVRAGVRDLPGIDIFRDLAV